jgi:hypothetical protein
LGRSADSALILIQIKVRTNRQFFYRQRFSHPPVAIDRIGPKVDSSKRIPTGSVRLLLALAMFFDMAVKSEFGSVDPMTDYLPAVTIDWLVRGR